MPFPSLGEPKSIDLLSYQLAQQQQEEDLRNNAWYSGGTSLLQSPAPRIGTGEGSFLGSFLPAFAQPVIGGFARGFGKQQVDNQYNDPSTGYLGLLAQSQSASPEDYQSILKSNPEFQSKFGTQTELLRGVRQGQQKETQKEDQLNLLKIIPELQKAGIDASPLLKKAGMENLSIAESPERKKEKYAQVDDLRNKFDASDEAKRYTKGKEIIDSLEATLKSNSPYDAPNLLYGVLKLMDDGSSIQEGDKKVILAAGSPLQRFKGQMENVLFGTGEMTAETERLIVDLAKSRFAGTQASYQKRGERDRDIATRRGLPTEDLGFAPITQAPPPVPPGYKFVGFDPNTGRPQMKPLR